MNILGKSFTNSSGYLNLTSVYLSSLSSLDVIDKINTEIKRIFLYKDCIFLLN